MKIIENMSLLAYNTFGVDASASYFVEYTTKAELINFLQSDIAKNNKLLQIGGGSNLLFISNYDGVVLHSGISYVEKINEDDEFVYLEVGSGVVWDDFVLHCVKNNWYGMENLSVIPGEVGASAVQNIGAYGVEAKDYIVGVNALEIETLNERLFTNQDCKYGYRDSIFKKELKGKYIVLSVCFKLKKIPSYNLNYQHLEQKIAEKGIVNLDTIRQTVVEMRNQKLPDPKVLGNAGSFFMNPIVPVSHFEKIQEKYTVVPHYILNEKDIKIPAAWLIEQCGWKGKRVANVGVHKDQALVIVNFGGATGLEIKLLSEEIQRSVLEQFEILLHPEVLFIE